MTERPILFSAPMVRAILARRKTQTRRIAKLPKAPSHRGGWIPDEVDSFPVFFNQTTGACIGCPYGWPGDRLWVKETFTVSDPPSGYYYRADHGPYTWGSLGEPTWKPSIFMPRRASRIDLVLVSVRAQLLHDISEADAEAEGVDRDTEPCDHTRLSCAEIGCMGPTYRSSFCELWGTINGADSWATNPPVWVVEFRAL